MVKLIFFRTGNKRRLLQLEMSQDLRRRRDLLALFAPEINHDTLRRVTRTAQIFIVQCWRTNRYAGNDFRRLEMDQPAWTVPRHLGGSHNNYHGFSISRQVGLAYIGAFSAPAAARTAVTVGLMAPGGCE
jgi:hypothetical protein